MVWSDRYACDGEEVGDGDGCTCGAAEDVVVERAKLRDGPPGFADQEVGGGVWSCEGRWVRKRREGVTVFRDRFDGVHAACGMGSIVSRIAASSIIV